MRDEDRVTLREVLFAEYENPTSKDGSTELDILAERLDLVKLLDLPMVVLSNGQTRRARIAKANRQRGIVPSELIWAESSHTTRSYV